MGSLTFLCKSTIDLAITLSCKSLHSSKIYNFYFKYKYEFLPKTTKKRSNLDIIGADMLRLFFKDLDLSYLPYTGLAAAKTEALAFNVA